jgi:uncharacterized protein involved in outer membrane biogenesis
MNPSRRPLRVALTAVAAVLVVGLGAIAVLIARFDPNTYKPDIILAVKHATGRDLALRGKISLKPSLWPTIRAEDVTFSNPPGLSRPQMATLQGMELQLALLPLLSSRFEIDRLVIIRPDILLETDAAGHPNWQMTPEVSPSAPAGTQEPVKSGKTTTAVSVASIRIQGGTVGYRDDRTGKVSTLGLPKLEATAASADAPLHVDAAASYNGTAFNMTADTGSLSRLQDPAATSPWPVKLALNVGTAKLAADGTLTQPLSGKGYDLAVSGIIPDAATLTPLLQGFVPPPLHDISFAAKIADKGAALPEVSTLTLRVGASDLSAQVPGLTLGKLDIAAASPDQPLKADATGKLGDQPLALAATTGPLALLLPGAKVAPFPVDATFQAAGATIAAKGSFADARAMTGANIALSAQIPDLSTLSPLARRPLPAVKQVAFHATLADAAGGLRNGVALHGMSFGSAEGDLSGDIAVGLSTRTSLTAELKSNRIDLDALQAAIDQMPGSTTASPPPASPPPASGPAPASPAPPKRTERLFSDQPIPFNLLRSADADLRLNIAALRSGGADYKAIGTRAVVKDGKLAVAPFTADIPGGHLAGSFSADASQVAPPVHVVLRAPGLALKSVLAAEHQPSYATGNLEVYADLRGAGETPHAIASTLDGSLGIAMAGGAIDNRLLGSLLGKVMDSLNAMDLVGKGGTSELRCFGLRIDAQHGTGTFKALALSSSLLTMSGSGSVNLGEETLAMALQPRARVAGTNVVIPVNVTGPIRNPAVSVNRVGTAESNAGTVAGAVIGNATPLGIVGGLLGDKLLGGATADICAPALAAARGQPVPAPEAARPGVPNTPAPGTPNTKAPNPDAILRNLFR